MLLLHQAGTVTMVSHRASPLAAFLLLLLSRLGLGEHRAAATAPHPELHADRVDHEHRQEHLLRLRVHALDPRSALRAAFS